MGFKKGTHIEVFFTVINGLRESSQDRGPHLEVAADSTGGCIGRDEVVGDGLKTERNKI